MSNKLTLEETPITDWAFDISCGPPKIAANKITNYRVMQGTLCLFESTDLIEVIKYVQEINFEASLMLLKLRAKEMKVYG